VGVFNCAVFPSGAQHVDRSVRSDCVEALIPLDDRVLWKEWHEVACCSSSAFSEVKEASSVSAKGLGLISRRDLLEELAVKPGTSSASQEQSSKGDNQEVRVVPISGGVNA
jgi:hypothetical protein